MKKWGWRILQAVAIMAAVFWIYAPALTGSWLWDDDFLISQNQLVHDPDGIWKIWFEPTNLIDFFPLTVTVEWLEWQLWPDSTLCYHLTSIVLQMISALLVWHLFAKLGLRLAWLGGLIFAVHPAMVESVAWMAELKNTLSLPPFLLAMSVWVDFERRGRRDDYFLALGLFLVAMLCKTTMVMFPAVILLFAWWKRGRVGWRDVRNSLPFFAISVGVTLTLLALVRHGVGEETIPLGGFLSRLACAGLSLSFYFSKCFLPIGLTPLYPQWAINPPSPVQFLPWLVLGGVMWVLWRKRAIWGRHVLLGLGFFLLNLLPFVGFHAISFMRFSWVMDHFLYLPILGLLGLVVAAAGDAEERMPAWGRLLGGMAVVAIMALFIGGSREYAKVYRSPVALWRYVIEENPEGWVAHNDLGNALADAAQKIEALAAEAENDEAARQHEEALQIRQEAAEQYEEALRINPGYPEAHNNLGIILAGEGRTQEAIDQFQAALKYCPELEAAQDNLARLEASQKNGAAPGPTHPREP